MSNFLHLAKHPETGKVQTAEYLDDYYGPHRYGVRFPDGRVFRDSEVESVSEEDVEAVEDE